MANPNEQLQDDEGLIDPELKRAKEKEQESETSRQEQEMKGLTEAERERVRKGESIFNIAQEKKKITADISMEVDSMHRDGLLSKKEADEYRDALTTLPGSAEKAQELKDKLLKEKEERSAKDQELAKDLPPDHPEIMKLKARFDETLKDALKKGWIGTEQEEEYREWIDQEIATHPNRKYLEQKFKEFSGEIFHKDGLAPRKQEFQRLKSLFERFRLKDPLECEFIKQASVEDRQTFRQTAENIAHELERGTNTGFHSKEAVQKIMQRVLKAKNNEDQNGLKVRIGELQRREAKAFVDMEAAVSTIQGTTIRTMSPKSIEAFKKYYSSLDLDDLDRELNALPNYIKNEEKLARDLEEVYINPKQKINLPKGLKIALKTFVRLSYHDKENFVEDHRKGMEVYLDENERRKTLLLKGVERGINDAHKDGYLSERSRKNYLAFFNDKKNWKIAGKQGLDALEEMHDILLSETPDEKNKNLAAYEANHTKYFKDIEELKELHPTISPEELAKWEKPFNEGGWNDRDALQKKLKPELEKRRKEADKRKKLEKAVGKDKQKKPESKEKDLDKESVLKIVNETVVNVENPEEAEPKLAMRALLDYDDEHPKDPQIKFWIKVVGEFMDRFGTGKPKELSGEENAEIEEAVKAAAEQEQTQDDLEELQRQHLAGELIEEHAQRFDRERRAFVRSKKEILKKTSGRSEEERELVEDFFEQEEADDDSTYTLDEEGRGEKIVRIQVNENREKTDNEKLEIDKKLYEEQLKMHKGGSAELELRDKENKVITMERAKTMEKAQKEKLEETLVQKTAEKVSLRKGAKTPGADFVDIQQKLAMRRKAKNLIEKESSELMEKKAA